MAKGFNNKDHEHLNEDVYTNLHEELGADLMMQIIEIFLSDSPSKIESIRAGFAQGNAKKIADVAHSFKSSSASLGAHRLSELCSLLEEGAFKSSLETLQTTFALLEQEFLDVCLELKGKTSSAA